MSKIANAFKDGKAFIGFLTAGDPTIEKTVEYILAMEEAGCDLIEIGIPFSDPMAEGVVIQDANIRALGHNTTTDDVFEIVRKVRQKTDVPLVFLTYINPVFFYGYEKFFKKCGELGIDGIISPDLPYEEKGEIKDIALSNDVDVISLIAPTSKERIQKIASDATGFIYVVSSLGVCCAFAVAASFVFVTSPVFVAETTLSSFLAGVTRERFFFSSLRSSLSLSAATFLVAPTIACSSSIL